MATLPGAPIKPANWGQSAVLYCAVDECGAVVNGAPVGPMGRMYVIPVGKPTKVPEEVARFMLAHMGYTGVVRVRETALADGVHYEVKEAHQESLAKSKEADEIRFRAWLSGIIEDYVKRNKPVPVPDEPIRKIIERRHYDLKQYGIVPVGFAEKERDNEMDQLKQRIKELESLVEKATQPKE